MYLPGLEYAVVDMRKIIEYLLSEENSEGKAVFFKAFGFRTSEWEVLSTALREHAAKYPVAQSATNQHGTKYIIEGEIQAPDGRMPRIRVVWIIDQGKTAPRLVTAYPI